MIDSIIFGYLVFFSIHFIIFLLYQFDILRIREKSMIRWIRVTNVLETVFLIITHIFSLMISDGFLFIWLSSFTV